MSSNKGKRKAQYDTGVSKKRKVENSGGKKSFSETLLELTNPKPLQSTEELDPEAAYWLDAPLLDRYQPEDEEYTELGLGKHVPIGRRFVSLDDELSFKYKGKKFSRQQFLDDGASTPLQHFYPDSEEENDEDEADEFEDEGDMKSKLSKRCESKSGNSEEDSEGDSAADGDDFDSEGDVDFDEFDEDQFEEDEDGGKQKREKSKGSGFNFDEELDLTQDASAALYGEKGTSSLEKEIQKARDTRNQKQLWHSLLAIRIALQSSLLSSNQLPQKENLSTYLSADSSLSAEQQSASNAVCDLLSHLLQLQRQLLSHNSLSGHNTLPSSSPDTPNFSADTDTEVENNVDQFYNEVSEYLKQQGSAMQQFEKEVVEKWNTKLILSNSLNASKFKSFNQSPMTQVESLLADEDNKQKLINRSSLKAGDYRVIGAKQDTQSQHAPKKGSQQKKSTQVHSYDPEIYDDPEFYDFVLREFVQDGISDTSDPLVMTQQYLKLKRLQQRKKKQVDTRASKGRKLRYHTHDKLVGFMTAQPQKYPEFDSPMARALFASLLGTKRTLF